MRSGKVVNFDEHFPHKVSEVICVNCCKQWIAVRPSNTKLKCLQCPDCKKQGYVIETGEELNEEEYNNDKI